MTQTPPLPQGWESAFDPLSGRQYYCNRTSGETSWTPPGQTFNLPSHNPNDATTLQTGVKMHTSQQHFTNRIVETKTQSLTQAVNATSTSTSTYGVPSFGIVSSVRTMLEQEMFRNKTNNLELEGLSVGSIADLCNIAKDQDLQSSFAANMNGGDFALCNLNQPEPENFGYYAPIQPQAMPATSQPPQIEAGRVDIRLQQLNRQLGQIE